MNRTFTMRLFYMVPLALIALGFSATAAHATYGVYGGTNFSRSSYEDNVRTYSDRDDLYVHNWGGSMGLGVGVSQLVAATPTLTPEGQLGSKDKIVDSSVQMVLNGSVERKWVGPLSAESGLSLSAQLIPANGMNSAAGHEFKVRYMTIPVLARLHVFNAFSIGLGGFMTTPIDEGNLLARNKLNDSDLGGMASARLNFKATRSMDWIIEANFQRGMVHFFTTEENHIRNFNTVAGIAARL